MRSLLCWAVESGRCRLGSLPTREERRRHPPKSRPAYQTSFSRAASTLSASWMFGVLLRLVTIAGVVKSDLFQGGHHRQRERRKKTLKVPRLRRTEAERGVRQDPEKGRLTNRRPASLCGPPISSRKRVTPPGPDIHKRKPLLPRRKRSRLRRKRLLLKRKRPRLKRKRLLPRRRLARRTCTRARCATWS